jgi:hypothetical protein
MVALHGAYELIPRGYIGRAVRTLQAPGRISGVDINSLPGEPPDGICPPVYPHGAPIELDLHQRVIADMAP